MTIHKTPAVAAALACLLAAAAMAQMPQPQRPVIYRYQIAPVAYVVNTKLLSLQPVPAIVAGAPTACDAPPPVCQEPAPPSCQSCKTGYVYKVCVPNLLPSLIHDLDCSFDRLIRCMCDRAPRKICIPILPVLPLGSRGRKLNCSQCGTCCDPGAGLPGPPIPDEGNPFQDDAQSPPLPPPEAIPLPQAQRRRIWIRR